MALPVESESGGEFIKAGLGCLLHPVPILHTVILEDRQSEDRGSHPDKCSGRCKRSPVLELQQKYCQRNKPKPTDYNYEIPGRRMDLPKRDDKGARVGGCEVPQSAH